MNHYVVNALVTFPDTHGEMPVEFPWMRIQDRSDGTWLVGFDVDARSSEDAEVMVGALFDSHGGRVVEFVEVVEVPGITWDMIEAGLDALVDFMPGTVRSWPAVNWTAAVAVVYSRMKRVKEGGR